MSLGMVAPHLFTSRNPWPVEITPVFQAGVSAAGGALTTALPANATMTNYLTDLTITCTQVAAVVSGAITVTGLLGAVTYTIEYVETVAAGGFYDRHWETPFPANAINTAITINVPVIAGGGVVAVNLLGYLA